jgi:hypothetical protein
MPNHEQSQDHDYQVAPTHYSAQRAAYANHLLGHFDFIRLIALFTTLLGPVLFYCYHILQPNPFRNLIIFDSQVITSHCSRLE